MSRAHKGEQGAAAVEFALVAMLLVAIVCGIIEFGRLWAVQASLAQATRDAAREMAIHGNAEAAEAHLASVFFAFGDSVAWQASHLVPDVRQDGLAGTSACRAVASATYTADALTGFFGGEFTVSAEAAMRCNG